LGEAGGKEICIHGDALASSQARLKHQTGKEGDKNIQGSFIA
jgi:hypothetical protein